MSITGSLFGLAYGDAMGKPTEFAKMKELVKIYGVDGPSDLPPPSQKSGVVKVTDDTQMALAVGEALTTAAKTGYITTSHVTVCLTDQFVSWYESPDNTADRAPGGTCMSACAKLSHGLPWWECARVDAKGCGANMRVTPVGLADWLTAEQRSGIAQLQAAMTHWHPTALAASDVTQYAVHVLQHGVSARDLMGVLLDYIAETSKLDPREWVGDILDDGGRAVNKRQAIEWAKIGWDETRDALGHVQRAWNSRLTPSRYEDPCQVGGEGWIAEEALATAVHCFMLYPDDGARVVSRAAMSSGDSDSIAALAGAFAGASLGLRGFPDGWQFRIEYAAQLQDLAYRLS